MSKENPEDLLTNRAQHHQMVEALRKSKEFTDSLITAMQDGVIVIDKNGFHSDVNPAFCRMTGFLKEEIIGGGPPYPYWPIGDFDRIEKFSKMILQEKFRDYEANFLRKNGERFPVIVSPSCVKDQQGNVISYLATVKDVTDQKQYEERLKILHKIDHAILETKPLDELIPMVFSNLRQLVNCQRVSIVTYDMENHEVSVLNVNVNVETIWGTGRRFSQEIYEIPKEFEQGGFSLIGDLQVYKEQTPIHKDLLSEGIHTYLSVPLIVQRELIGAIHLGAHQPDAFDLEQIEIAREFASQMAIAIGQQRLDEQVRVGRAQLRKLTQRVLSVQDEERRRLSRELHDEAGQDLTALKISLELIKKEIPLEFNAIHDRLGEAITLTDITMEQIRLLAKGLRPPALDAVGLKYTLEDLCRDFARRSNIKIEYTGADLPLLSEEINICFYRILQESLTNACKHARADHIFVTLRQEVGNICLVVKDDGQGFRKKNLNRNSMGIGLLGIKERLKMLGGRFEVKSQPGQGTILIAYIPWQENT